MAICFQLLGSDICHCQCTLRANDDMPFAIGQLQTLLFVLELPLIGMSKARNSN